MTNIIVPRQWTAFYAAIKHEHKEEVLKILLEYDIEKYIIGLETAQSTHSESNGQHMHFMVQMYPKDYTRFAKRVFIDKYNLRGRALADKPRQYGKVKTIENIQKMMCYTVKDGNLMTNMDEDTIQELIKQSFKKEDKKTEYEKLYEALTEFAKEANINAHSMLWVDGQRKIKEKIIEEIVVKDYKIDMTEQSVHRMLRSWLRMTPQYGVYDKVEIFKKLCYCSLYKSL